MNRTSRRPTTRAVSATTAPAFSFANVGVAFKILMHLIRTSAPDISINTFKRFIFAKNGNKERLASITGIFASDPYALQKIVHSIDGNFKTLDNAGETAYIIRDFDLWMKCSTKLGHRGDYLPALFFQCFKGAALNSQPERYGECPYGNWDEYKVQEPHYMSRDRFPEQKEVIEDIVEKHFEKFIGKTVEMSKLMRLLVWNVYTTTTFGVPPSEDTERMLRLWDAHLPEFDYAVRMAGAKVPYEWPQKLKDQVQEMEDWGKAVFDDRVKNIDKYKHQSDVLTDTILNHGDVSLVKSEGAIRGVYGGGMNNFESAICGALIYNCLNDEFIYNYLKENRKQNLENVLKESLRLYTSIPTFRNVREQDDVEIGGKKLPVGTDVLLSTYAVNTDPRSWENPMEFNPDRFNNTEEIGFLCQKGFAPLGASANLGGRPCGARYHISNMMEVMLDTILSKYKLTAKRGGYWEFRQNAGQCRYAGKCYVKVEKR